MASWGYLVIQYNLPLFWIIPDANEVGRSKTLQKWRILQWQVTCRACRHPVCSMSPASCLYIANSVRSLNILVQECE